MGGTNEYSSSKSDAKRIDNSSYSLSLSLLTLVGCKSDHNNPLDPGMGRIAQDFQGVPWGSGLKLDSASSMWITDQPSYPQLKGDLATYDDVCGFSPLITVFVKALEGGAAPNSKIGVIAFDSEDDIPDLNATIAASTQEAHTTQFYCRYPSVEVTYAHDENSQAAYLEIHVVWEQVTGMDPDNSWDLFYKCINIPVDLEEGVQWDQVNIDKFPATHIHSATTDYHELGADLAVDAENGCLLVTFVKMTKDPYPPDECKVWVMGGVIQDGTPATWVQNQWQVSDNSNYFKATPKIDVGLMNLNPADPRTTTNIANIVWSQAIGVQGSDEEGYEIWFAEAPPGDPGSLDPEPITTSTFYEGENYDYVTWDFLPSIDIPAPSSVCFRLPNHQAVICYNKSDYKIYPGAPNIQEKRIYCQITPALGNEILLAGDEDHSYTYLDMSEPVCPDVACYQMPEGLRSTKQWIGVAMYDQKDGYGGSLALEPWTISYNFYVDSSGNVTEGATGFSWYEDDSTYTSWSPSVPSIGPTLCLRDTNYSPLIQYQTFGLGWSEGASLPPATKLSSGDIQY
jgi:hypothetical protein